MPFFNAEKAIQEFGLPDRIAKSGPAQSVQITSAARGTAMGIALFALYYQRKYTAVDTLLSTLVYVGLVDGFVCWKEDAPSKGLFHAGLRVAFGSWGLFGLTSDS